MALQISQGYLTRYAFLIGLIVVISAAFGFANPNFYSIENLGILLRSIAVLSLIGMTMTYVMITGGIDLSVGSTVAFASAVGALTLTYVDNALLAMLAACAAGTAIGLLNGYVVARLQLSAFMITLATMALARGLTLVILNANAIAVTNPAFLWLGGTSYGPLPVVILFVAVAYLLLDLVLKRSVLGRDIYAVGANRATAYLLGRKTVGVTMTVYALCGFMAGIGGIITVGRVSSAQPWAGLNLEFDAITAVILGGTSLFGGEGRLAGTLIGVILYGIIINGLIVTGANPYLQNVIKGSILLFVVILDQLNKRRKLA